MSVGYGFTPGATTLTVYNDDLIAGGSLTAIDYGEIGHVARWDGEAWTSLGAGVDRPLTTVLAFDGHLYCGGSFRNAGHKLSRYVARWDD